MSKAEKNNNPLIKLSKYFNSNILVLSRYLAQVCPTSFIATNIKYIEGMLYDKSHKYWTINLFVVKVLPYKEIIDKNDENFFLTKQYTKDFEGYDSYINKVFEFKDIWHSLNYHDKQMLFQYLQVLCVIALEYYKIATKECLKV